MYLFTWIIIDYCVYLNGYMNNLDVRRCIEEQYLTCSKSQFISSDNIKCEYNCILINRN